MTGSADVADRREDSATVVVEVEVVRAVAIGRTGAQVAAAADIDEAAIVAVQTTRSRIPNRGGAAKLVAEVHSFICGVPGMGERTAGICRFGPDAT